MARIQHMFIAHNSWHGICYMEGSDTSRYGGWDPYRRAHMSNVCIESPIYDYNFGNLLLF